MDIIGYIVRPNLIIHVIAIFSTSIEVIDKGINIIEPVRIKIIPYLTDFILKNGEFYQFFYPGKIDKLVPSKNYALVPVMCIPVIRNKSPF